MARQFADDGQRCYVLDYHGTSVAAVLGSERPNLCTGGYSCCIHGMGAILSARNRLRDDSYHRLAPIILDLLLQKYDYVNCVAHGEPMFLNGTPMSKCGDISVFDGKFDKQSTNYDDRLVWETGQHLDGSPILMQQADERHVSGILKLYRQLETKLAIEIVGNDRRFKQWILSSRGASIHRGQVWVLWCELPNRTRDIAVLACANPRYEVSTGIPGCLQDDTIWVRCPIMDEGIRSGRGHSFGDLLIQGISRFCAYRSRFRIATLVHRKSRCAGAGVSRLRRASDLSYFETRSGIVRQLPTRSSI